MTARGCRLALSLFAALGLAGCGDHLSNDSDVPTFQAPYVNRTEVLEKFPLLDKNGSLRPPEDEATHTWPFGVLVGFRKAGGGSYCSCSHLSPGVVGTNAHCFPPGAEAADYFVVFYDTEGHKVYRAIDHLIYRGNKNKDDVAILGLTSADAKLWHTVGKKVHSTESAIGKTPPVTLDVTVWSFDPVKEHPGLQDQFGSIGMLFAKKQCLSSRTLPSTFGLKMAGDQVEERNAIKPEYVNADLHLFIDSCDHPLIHGNSGSLVSTKNSVADKVALFHWGVGPSDRAGYHYNRFEYLGNQNKTIFYDGMPPNHEFFSVGTVFDYIVKQVPELSGE